MEKLRIAVTARSLFDMEQANRIYKRKGLHAYIKHMTDTQEAILPPGAAFPLVKLLSNLRHPTTGEALCETVLISQNHADSALKIVNNLEHHKLPISQTVFTGGTSQIPYILNFNIDLLLSINDADVIAIAKHKIPAAKLFPINTTNLEQDTQIRIAFDGDAVLFSGESEQIYQVQGLDAFRAHEVKHKNIPMNPGPFMSFCQKIHQIQTLFSTTTTHPIRTALITARDVGVLARPLKTLNHYGVSIDEAVSMGGYPKSAAIKAFNPHIFFDDRRTTIEQTSILSPSGVVPFEAT